MYKKLLSLWMLTLLCGSTFAQPNVSVSAKIEPTEILMGEQSKVQLQVSFPKGSELRMPFIPGDTLVQGIEILSISKSDTTDLKNNIVQITQECIVTSFDSSLYYIEHIPVVVGKDTFYSNSLALKVVGMPVDTTKMELFDIKGVEQAPFVWMDWHYYILGYFALFCAIIWGIIIYRWYKKRKTLQVTPEKVMPSVPADELALQQLEELKSEKLPQQERLKEYYSRLTDIVRLYMDYQFGIEAVEMTSEEIYRAIAKNGDLKPLAKEMKALMETADLVKFAKFETMPDENERAWIQAKTIVEESTATKKQREQAEAEAIAKEKAKAKAENEKKRKKVI